MIRSALLCCLVVAPAWAESVPRERRITHREQSLTIYEPFTAEELWRRIAIPPSPALDREQALESFRVARGFRIECVAAEPLIEDPVQFEFDPDGRIWAVEMRGYMRDIEGRGEGDPIGRIVVLEDTDNDTFMDTSTVFLDGLVMARSLQFVQGGVLVQEPPNLWYCQDTDGDLRCDRKRLVGTLGTPGNPQHTDNSLFRSLDNWMYNARSDVRHKFIDGELIEDKTFRRGQWGMGHDDFGRLYYCYESSPLHVDLVPAERLYRNRHFQQNLDGDRNAYGLNVAIGASAREVHPIRVAPGITLGGHELRDDGTLRTFTIAAGPSIYRGNQFPPEYYGCAVIPEAGGNLVRLNKLSRDGVHISVQNYFDSEQLEWVASTDERFRPVNSRTGPDGAVYVCDMYKGIIEHVVFMMPYLRRYIEKQGLEAPVGMGRIYRIRWADRPLGEVPKMSAHSRARWVDHLSHPNGWWRDTAQRLLVDAKAVDQSESLQTLATSGESAFGRLHALWTLEGIDRLDWPTIDRAMDDKDATVRATAVRLADRFADRGAPVLDRLISILADARPMVRLQLLLTLGAFRGERAEHAMMAIVTQHPETLFFAAAVSGLQERELEFLRRLLAHPHSPTQNKPTQLTELYAMLAMAVFNERDPDRIARLLDLAAEQNGDQAERRRAIIDGVLGSTHSRAKWPEPVRLAKRPAILDRRDESHGDGQKNQLERLVRVITWPGDTIVRPEKPNPRPLTVEEEIRFDRGRALYAVTCHACHQHDGQGQPGSAPSLVESPWVNGPQEQLIRIALHGLAGPVEVHGQTWNLVMPGLGRSTVMNDERMAAVLTYVRRAWGNWGDPIDAQQVASTRRQSAGRSHPWTVAEIANAGTGTHTTETPHASALIPSDPLAPYRDARVGGDAERGRVLFHTNLKLRCRACHVVGETGGGFVGPDLSDVGSRADRQHLLESLIDPSATIAKGFENLVVLTIDGRSHSGTLVFETEDNIAIAPPTGGQIVITKTQIEERFISPISSMPPVADLFTVEELGHLVAYLSSLRSADREVE